MAVDLSYEIWNALKHTWSQHDRVDAADILVNVLIDNDYDAEQIRDIFKSDSDIKCALQSFIGDSDDEDNDEDEYEQDDY